MIDTIYDRKGDSMKTITVYFGGQNPETSTMTQVAKAVSEVCGADLFEIKPVYPYSTNMKECTDRANKEKDENARPEVMGPMPILDDYSTMILGMPNWCGSAPMIVLSFLDAYYQSGALKNIRIIPYIINDGAGPQECVKDLERTYPDLTIDEGSSFIANKYDTAVPLAIEWIAQVM